MRRLCSRGLGDRGRDEWLLRPRFPFFASLDRAAFASTASQTRKARFYNMTDPYQDIRTCPPLAKRRLVPFTALPLAEDALGSREQDFLEDEWGGYSNFMASYGLKPWDDDDMDVGFELIHQFAEERDERDEPPELEEIPREVKQEENEVKEGETSSDPGMEAAEDVKPPVKDEEEEDSF